MDKIIKGPFLQDSKFVNFELLHLFTSILVYSIFSWLHVSDRGCPFSGP
jgi:hypothetical protein